MFLDNASTTKVNIECMDILNEYNLNKFYNPGALYKDALNVNIRINQCRKNMLKYLGANSTDNFIFTSGATEGNNTIINTVKRFKKGKFLFSEGEHPSVYNCALALKTEGYDVEFIKLNKFGVVDLDDYATKINQDVVFISVMHVNNETGAINPIKTLVQMAKNINNKILFHSDGVQAFGKIPVNVSSLGVDYYTVSGHKIGAPKGIGGIYVKKDKYVKPLIIGGGQEFDLRSGTENVAGICALEKASQLSQINLQKHYEQICLLNQKIKNQLKCVNDCVVISNEFCSPYIISFSLPGLRAETILHMLDEEGIIVGSGSACSSKKKNNRVLSACGFSSEIIEGSLRISFSKHNLTDDFTDFKDKLIKVINLYKGNVKKWYKRQF